MDPRYLLKEELEYELECRGVRMQSTVPVLKKVLNELMLAEQSGGRARDVITPARKAEEVKLELDICATKLSVLSNYIAEIVGKPDKTLFRRLVSRLYHVQNRVSLVTHVAEDDGLRKDALQQQCQILLEKLEALDDEIEDDNLTVKDKELLQQSLGDLGVRIAEKLDSAIHPHKESEVTPVGSQGLPVVSEMVNKSVNFDAGQWEGKTPGGRLRLLRSSTLEEESPKRKLVPIYQWGLKFTGSNMSINAFLERVLELRDARNATDFDLWRYAIDFFEADALIWYWANKEYASNWEDLVILLKRSFQKPFYQEELLAEIRARTQGRDEIVLIYVSIMQNMFNRLPNKLSEMEKICILLRNIQPYYQRAVCRDEFSSVSDLINVLRIVERTKVNCDRFEEPKGKKSKILFWTNEAEVAFIKLKTLLTSAPVVTCPDYSKPFIIQCDASNNGIGAVLCQKIGEEEQPVAYLSRKLNDREKKYSTSERELLSIVYAIEKFRPYVDGVNFTVVTDHSALQWLHKMKDPHGRLARWAMKLQQFSYDIIHRPGKNHVVPDALSRGSEVITEINNLEILERHKDNWYKSKVREVQHNTLEDWRVMNGCLYKKIKLKSFPNAEDVWKLYVPEALRNKVLIECHDDVTAGHLGVRKTYFKIKQKYFWPNLLNDVKQYVLKCDSCAKHKVSQQGPLGYMGRHREVTRPWQIISIDLMGPFPKSRIGNTMLLVITCWFSKLVLLFPMRTGKADKICDIVERQFLLYGAPKAVICDNGRQFCSQLFKDLGVKYGSQLWFTPNYHAQSNPTERVNRVIGTMISSYIKPGKHNTWDDNLPQIGHAIRTAVHETTGFTPSYLFFGREKSVPNVDRPNSVQLLQNQDNEYPMNITEYVASVEYRNGLYERVQQRLRLAHDHSRRLYDSKRKPCNFKVGDVVWKRTKLLSSAPNKFMAKLAPKFEKALVVGKLSDTVFRLNNVAGKCVGNWHVKDLKPLKCLE